MRRVFDLVVFGAGPAGMMAAISASFKAEVCLLEKNAFLGKKLLLTGRGRCNLTTAKSIDEIVEAFGRKGRFLYGALTRFSPQRLRLWFEERGIALKVERGGRVFPVSDKAEDVLQALEQGLKDGGVEVRTSFEVKDVLFEKGVFKVLGIGGGMVLGKKLLLATGGVSYPGTGSTGDGYTFAKKFGHKILKPKPALVGLVVEDKEVRVLAGLALKNVRISFFTGEKVLTSEFGEMIFTHVGISGPIVLTCSKLVAENLLKGKKVKASIDLKPALDKSVLQKRIHREIHKNPKKEYQTILKTLLPSSLISYAVKETNGEKHQQASLLKKEQIKSLISFLKNWEIDIKSTEPIQKAIVTNGGVPIAEISSKTMESKLKKNLYFAGEIISLPGSTGGFNLQKAFSTGWVAGRNI